MFRRLAGRQRGVVATGLTLTDPIQAWNVDQEWLGARMKATETAAHWASKRLIADNVAKLPLRATQLKGGVIVPTDLPEALMRPPRRWPSRYDWMFAVVESMASSGNGVGLMQRVGSTLVEIEWIPTHDLQPVEEIGEPLKITRNGKPLGEFLHLPLYPTARSVWSPSPEARFRQTLDLAAFAQAYAVDWYKNGAHPSTILRLDAQNPTSDQAKEIKQRFKEAAANREPAVVGGLLGVEALQKAPESIAQDALDWVVNEVARIHNIPVEMLGGRTGTGLTYSNREQRKLEFFDLALDTYLRRIETVFSERIAPAGVSISFDVNAATRIDRDSQIATDNKAVEGGTTTINEIRRRRGEEPIEGGDVSATNIQRKAAAAVTLIKAGAEKSAALEACGLPDIPFEDVQAEAPPEEGEQ